MKNEVRNSVECQDLLQSTLPEGRKEIEFESLRQTMEGLVGWGEECDGGVAFQCLGLLDPVPVDSVSEVHALNGGCLAS